MQIRTEIAWGDQVIADQPRNITNLGDAKSDTLLSLAQIIQSGFDGGGRTASARIMDGNRRLLATMSLTLDVRDD